MKRVAGLVLAALLWPANAGAFDLQGHRGARGLAPENSLPAFAAALSLGVTTLELDVVPTGDRRLAVGHDPVLDGRIARGPDGQWLKGAGPAVYSLTYGELARFDVGRLNPDHRYASQFPNQAARDGTRMPLLADVFDLARRAGNTRVRFNIETKIAPDQAAPAPMPEEFAGLLVAELRATGMTARASVQSFDWRTLEHVRRLAPEIATACLTAAQGWLDNLQRGRPGPSPWTAGLDIDDHGGVAPRLVKAAGCVEWSSYYRELDPSLIALARGLGLKVLAWTVNEDAEMARLIDWGVDGVITDYPDRLRRIMAQKGLALPQATPIAP